MSKSQESPPLSRREARERERTSAEPAQQGIRRASTPEPTQAEPTQAEPIQAEPVQAEPVRAGDSPDAITTDSHAPEQTALNSRDEVLEPTDSEGEVPQPLSARGEPVRPFTYDPPPPAVISRSQGDDGGSRYYSDTSVGATVLPEHTMTRRQLRELREAHDDATVQAPEQRFGSEGATSGDIASHNTAAGFPEKTVPFANLQPDLADEAPSQPGEPAPSNPAVAQPTEPAPESVAPASKSFTPPVGHWSIAAQQDDDAPEFDELIAPGPDSSGYGATGNTIILSAIPLGASMRPLGKSGEALQTGSIDLPHGMSTTGQHPRFDSSELDRMFDNDEQRMETANVHTSNAQPVRASSAVSTHTSTRDVVTTAKGGNNRLPVVLAVSAGVMAVGVLGLFVAGAIWGAF